MDKVLFDVNGFTVKALPAGNCALCGVHVDELFTGLPAGSACRLCADSEDEFLARSMARALEGRRLSSGRR